MEALHKGELPRLGVGISLCPPIAAPICEHLQEFDCLEIMLDNVMNGQLDAHLARREVRDLPWIGHGVDSSIGTLEPLDEHYLRSVQQAARATRCNWFSDHLAFTHANDIETGMLMPVQFSLGNMDLLTAKIRFIRERIGVPFLIENIPYYFEIPGSDVAEIDFIVGLLERTGCGMLLDLNNLYANSVNHAFDPYRFVDKLPAAAIVEIHVAGGEMRGHLYIDTHGQPVNSKVLELLDYAVATKRPNAVILEREKNFPPMEDLLSELREMKYIWARHA
jgi:uncharacterized protein (UPF0276 family)